MFLAILSVILRVLRLRAYDPTCRARHGFSGWLHTETPDPRVLLHDPELLDVVFDAAVVELEGLGIRRFLRRLQTRFDPNDWGNVKANAEGVCLTPTATNHGRRNGTRELLMATRDAHPDRLEIRTHVLVTRVILDDNRRATGVAYVEGDHVYRADPRASTAPSISPEHTVSARREVILCAGAFNTPQLLKLSGIGPREELELHGIPVRVELPGVGENLQDRYEVGVISEMQSQFKLLRNVSFQAPSPGESPDETFQQWERGEGPYVTNGVVIAIMKRSSPKAPIPDLYVFGIPGYFKGYYPGYSRDVTKRKDLFTWAILKAHTENRAGSVCLRSKDPRDTPDIHFRYFQEGTNGGAADLDAVVHGVQFVRRIMQNANAVVAGELLPGAEVDSVDAIKDFIKREAWGHHASCSAKMGAANDPMAVVDSEFRVFKTTGLRVVDASIFPRIPGYFIVTSVYMIAEKASDVIAAAAAQGLPADTPATGAA